MKERIRRLFWYIVQYFDLSSAYRKEFYERKLRGE